MTDFFVCLHPPKVSVKTVVFNLTKGKKNSVSLALPKLAKALAHTIRDAAGNSGENRKSYLSFKN